MLSAIGDIRATISITSRNFWAGVGFAGQSAAQPLYAPPYWDKRDNPDLVGRYDSDPYHTPQRRSWSWRAS
jgi:hypothetical protein